MSQCEQPSVGPGRRRCVRLLAAALAAIAAFGVAAGTGDALAAGCPGANVPPTQANRAVVVRATLCLVNAERRDRGLTPLRASRRLSVAARRHSSDMVHRDYFAHAAPSGPSFLARIRHSGYLRSADRWTLGENLGWGSGAKSSARGIVRAWMHSPPHRKAILTSAYRDAGVGMVPGVPTSLASGGATYTLDFGVKH